MLDQCVSYLCCRVRTFGSFRHCWSAFSSMSSTVLSSCSLRCLKELHRAPRASASLCFEPSRFLTASISALKESASERHEARPAFPSIGWRWALQRLPSRFTASVSRRLMSGTMASMSRCSSSTRLLSQLPALSTVCLRPRRTPAATLWVCKKASSFSRLSPLSSSSWLASRKGCRELSHLPWSCWTTAGSQTSHKSLVCCWRSCRTTFCFCSVSFFSWGRKEDCESELPKTAHS